MSGSQQTSAGSKPRIRQDVLYSQTVDGVLFHNADLGFHVTSKSAYRLTSVLVPYLNGGHTMEQLCGGLDDGQRGMVGEIVSALLERGFARDTSADLEPEAELEPAVLERFATQISYIDHYTDSPRYRFAKLRTAKVAVLGDDLVARWCVAGLIRNGVSRVGVLPSLHRPETGFAEVEAEIAGLVDDGCAVELSRLDWPTLDWPAPDWPTLGWAALAGFDAVVISAAGLAPGLVTGLLTGGIPDGVVLLSATEHADKVIVGPSMTADRPGCWVCATLRFGANDESGAEVWSRTVVPATDPVSRLTAPHAATIGNLLAYEVFRVLTGTMPAETEGTVIVQRLDCLDAVTERLAPHPACPHCQAGPATDPIEQLVPTSSAITVAADATDADAAQVLLMQTAGRLVAPNVGVFTRFDDEQFTQLPLKVARLRLSLGGREHRAVTTFDTHHAVGARSSALLAAAQIYTQRVGPLPGVHGLREVLGLLDTGLVSTGRPVVEPGRLAIGSGSAVTAEQVGHWVGATSLLSGERFVVPAAAIRPFSGYNRDGLCVVTSAGTGAGHTLAEALGAGLASALAYDALLRAIRGGEVRAVDPSSFAPDPELVFLHRSAGNLELAVELLDLGEDRISGGHVLLARAEGPDGQAPMWTLGADLDRRRAAARALRDLIGVVQVSREFPGERVDPGDEVLRALDPYTLAALASAGPGEAAVDWPAVLERIGAAGRDVLAVPTTSTDLRSVGIETVRVLLVNGA